MINVHIIDDHKSVVEGLPDLLGKSGVINVTKISHTPDECRNALAFETPDVLMLDISLTNNDYVGISLCAEMHRKYPQMKIVAYTGHDEYSVVKRMMDAGASGYILKELSTREIIRGIETVMADEIFLCERIDALMNKRVERITVTEVELETLRLLAAGFDSKAIAKMRARSIDTVESTRKRLLLKFGAKNVAELIAKAKDEGWI